MSARGREEFLMSFSSVKGIQFLIVVLLCAVYLDACARIVCVNQHQVPNWNDICLWRCQNECPKLCSSNTNLLISQNAPAGNAKFWTSAGKYH
ncbi:unnamed protein product [Malus baccata var. baccata]